MRDLSFQEKATALGRRFALEKSVPSEVGYRWAKTFIQEAFNLSAQNWMGVRTDPCPESPQLVQWIEDFILYHKPLSRSQQKRFFYDAEFILNEATLDPRPETEGLVEYVVAQNHGVTSVLDLGTGSGCILLSILQAYPDAYGTGIDVQARALEAAQENAQVMGLNHRVRWYEGSWYTPLDLQYHAFFDVIVSNPPYISTEELSRLPPEVRHWDPVIALDGGVSGIVPYEEIISHAKTWLKPQGMLILEIPHCSAEVLSNLGQYHFKNVQLIRDLLEKWRYLVLR
jgi:release factor glutamine methyltransferase